MTPAAYVVIDEIPITTHGKIDRSGAAGAGDRGEGAIPRPVHRHRDAASPHCFPSCWVMTEVGSRRFVLRSRRPLIGGHQAGHRHPHAMRCRVGCPRCLRAGHGGIAGGAGRRPPFRYARAGATQARRDQSHDEPLPLSASQLRSWFAFRVDGPSPVNNIPFAARLTGPWDIDALIAAVGDVVARHEILRTTYVDDDGVPYQVVEPGRRPGGASRCRRRRSVAAGTTRGRAPALLRSWIVNGRSGSRCSTPATPVSTCYRWSSTTLPPTTGRPACCSPT